MDNKTLAKKWFSSIDKHDWSVIEGLMDAEHRFVNPMTPAPIGPKEHLGVMQGMTSAFAGEHILDLVLSDGQHAVVRGRWKGRHTGNFNGLAATGKNVEFTFTDIFQVRDNKVVNEYFEMNPGSLMQQIGATGK